MKVVGLTGGIGSGKSLVASIFRKMNIPVYDSDQRAKDLYVESEGLKSKMVLEFGPEVYTNNGINREYLAAIVFTNKAQLAKLNAIVHPVLQLDFDKWKALQKTPYVIREAAILIESRAHTSCDKIIVVTADEDTRIQRVIQRDSAKVLDVKKRIENQITDTERISYADFVIDNNGHKSIIEQVMKIHDNLSVI